MGTLHNQANKEVSRKQDGADYSENCTNTLQKRNIKSRRDKEK